MAFAAVGATLSHPCSPASEKNGVLVNVLQPQRKISAHSVCYQNCWDSEKGIGLFGVFQSSAIWHFLSSHF